MDKGISDEGFGIVFRGFTIQPGNSDIVYAQVELPTGTVGKGFSKVRGRVYRTLDGGLNWTAIWSGDNLARYLIIDPQNPNTLYLSTGIFDREASNSNCELGVAGAGGAGVLKSNDGGLSWYPVNTGLTDLYIGSLRMHPTNPQVLFAATGNYNCSAQPEADGLKIISGLFKTTNGGGSWSCVIEGDWMTTVNFCPSNPDIVYAGSAVAFYRSPDGGTTWKRLSKPPLYREWGPPGVRSGVPIDVTVDPNDCNVLHANNYGGGVFSSTDGAKNWEVRSRGYTGAEMHAVVIAGDSGSSLYVIGRSGPFKSENYGVDWIGIATGDASYGEWYAVSVQPGNTGVILVSDEHAGMILRSTHSGESFVGVFQHPSGTTFSGFKALEFAPSNPSTVYAGFARERNTITSPTSPVPTGPVLYKSVDGGATFAAPIPGLSGLNVIRLIVDPENADIVWAATSNGIYKTVDGGTTWNLLGALGNKYITAIAIDPNNKNTIIVGEKDVGIRRSADGGITWPGGPYNTGFKNPNPFITALAFDPDATGIVYASDLYSGVYTSHDGSNSWSGYPDDGMTGLSVKAVTNLAVGSRVAYATTRGGGVFRIGGPSVIPSPAAANFGSMTVGSSSMEQQITVYNTGTATRTITGINITGTDAADFSILNNGCTKSLTESASCTFNIVFSPKGTGVRTASAIIASDDQVVASYPLSLSGSGSESNSGGGSGGGGAGAGGGGGGCFITSIVP